MNPADFSQFVEITPSAPVSATVHGWRAKCLQRLIRMNLPVPRSRAIPASVVRAIAAGRSLPEAELGRLIAEGGLRLDNAAVSDPQAMVTAETVGDGIKVSIGKKKHRMLRPA